MIVEDSLYLGDTVFGEVYTPLSIFYESVSFLYSSMHLFPEHTSAYVFRSK